MCVGSMANFSSDILEEWTRYFGQLKEIMRNPVCDIPVLSARHLADLSRTPPPSNQDAQTSAQPTTRLRLTSVLHTKDRETLVCSNKVSAAAWSNDMGDARETPRVVRTEGNVNDGGVVCCVLCVVCCVLCVCVCSVC